MSEILDKILLAQKEPSNQPSLDKALAIGYPGKKTEDWKFFPAELLIKDQNELSEKAKTSGKVEFSEQDDFFHIMIHVGDIPSGIVYQGEGLDISIAESESSEAILNQNQRGEFFPYLNSAFSNSELRIQVEKGSNIPKPLRITWNCSGQDHGYFVFPKTDVNCKESSDLKIIEEYSSNIIPSPIFNTYFRAELGKNARLELNQVQDFENRTDFVGYHHINQERDSSFTSNLISLPNGRIRNNHQISLNGPGAESYLNGLFIPSDGNIIDNHTIVDHVADHCTSDENYKGIIFDKGNGIFNGKIFVREGAQKTMAFQSNKNILFGNNPTIHTKPQLEIWADDVKCTHGATTGRLDPQQLFYLRSRGIDPDEAERMLTRGFANEIIERISIEGFREKVEKKVLEHLKEAYDRN